MGTKVSYPIELKMKAIKMRLAEIPVTQVLEEVNIKKSFAAQNMDEMVSRSSDTSPVPETCRTCLLVNP